MTYRSDSDVFSPYGAIFRKNKTDENLTKIWESKTKNTLWLVSNGLRTNNKRKELVERLKEKGMDIDLYGKLYQQPPNCPRYGASDDCEREFQSPYKFTIAFENNNCKGYVTEKFWKKADLYKMVPIVMTRDIYQSLNVNNSLN
uniref:Fucosyltransferase n=2 Tax=Caenorhabditis japonica TaxID=281687 RepID=A0A8R1DV78_CAEJA